MSPPERPNRILAGIKVLDTPLIQKALSYARENLSDVAYNHIGRSWLLGQYIADNTPSLASRDEELQSIASILHDLGWSHNTSLISSDKRFEVDSANAAVEFVKREGVKEEWDERRLQLLWDAVALHTTASIAIHKEKEVKAVCVGIWAEFTPVEKAYGGVLTESVWNEIVTEFPRDGFKEGVKEILCTLCRTKPETTYDNFVGDVGDRYVEGYSLEGKKFPDRLAAVVN
ncbi:hypothetical protein VTL71DRAFT_10226 [Oculimacula yallundae]|uniref:HD domain-containing protein n=1 Tax=Oculimacula yallundae TaxID=86028 RepID=A0ABR4BRN2_9HELO